MKVMKANNMFDVSENYTGITKRSDGTKHWFLNGKHHRTDGPAVEFPGGDKHWYLNGKFHRTNGPAVEYSNGTKIWYLNDKLHREDGPAVIWYDGRKNWYLNGELLDENKINQFVDEFEYPIATAIKLVYWLEINKS